MDSHLCHFTKVKLLIFFFLINTVSAERLPDRGILQFDSLPYAHFKFTGLLGDRINACFRPSFWSARPKAPEQMDATRCWFIPCPPGRRKILLSRFACAS